LNRRSLAADAKVEAQLARVLRDRRSLPFATMARQDGALRKRISEHRAWPGRRRRTSSLTVRRLASQARSGDASPTVLFGAHAQSHARGAPCIHGALHALAKP